MKISEYSAATEITADQVLIIDGTSGTKKMGVADAVLSALHLSSVYNHRTVYRGKNLGSSFTTEQKAAVQNGTFKDLWIGDYWVINGVNWRIVDIDYWYNVGNPAFTDHHLVIMPDTALASGKMNDTSITTGGYTGSLMYTEGLDTAKSAINTAFGDAVKTHKEYLINTVASGYPSAGAWLDSTVELPNEPMIYGAYIYTPANNGSTDVKRYTNSNTQLAAFKLNPGLRLGGTGFWLRDIASSTHFARVDAYGGATSTGAANAYGVRPVFAIG